MTETQKLGASSLARIRRMNRKLISRPAEVGQTQEPLVGLRSEAEGTAMTEPSLIETMAKAIHDHVTLGGDRFCVAMEDAPYVDAMSTSADDVRKIVREMSVLAARAALRSIVESGPTERMLDAAMGSLRANGLNEADMDDVTRCLNDAFRAELGEGA